MTTAHGVQAAVQAAVSNALVGLTFEGKPLAVDVAIGWPPINRLQNVARGEPCIAIYDLRLQKNTTRWMPFSYDTVVIPATLTTAVSGKLISPGGSQTITLGNAVTPNDAVSAVITNLAIQPFSTPPPAIQAFPGGASVVIGGVSDSPTTMATALALAINTDPVLSTWVSASATGPVITVSALPGKGPFNLFSHTGNNATQTTELGRRERELQIVCWAQTEPMREAITDPIDTMIAGLEINFGLSVSDGFIRVAYVTDYDVEDATLQDAYRRDFRVTAEYAITTVDLLYSVLAPELAQYALAPPGTM